MTNANRLPKVVYIPASPEALYMKQQSFKDAPTNALIGFDSASNTRASGLGMAVSIHEDAGDRWSSSSNNGTSSSICASPPFLPKRFPELQ